MTLHILVHILPVFFYLYFDFPHFFLTSKSSHLHSWLLTARQNHKCQLCSLDIRFRCCRTVCLPLNFTSKFRSFFSVSTPNDTVFFHIAARHCYKRQLCSLDLRFRCSTADVLYRHDFGYGWARTAVFSVRLLRQTSHSDLQRFIISRAAASL